MILERLNSIELTNTEIEIRDYLLAHQDELSNLTIGKLAEYTYSSNASIIRLAKKLGCKGYKELMIGLIKEVEAKRYTKQEVNYDFPFTDGRPNEILKGLTDLYKEAADICLKEIDLSSIEKAVDLILKSKRVFILDYGDTKITAKAFMNRLIKLNIYCNFVEDEIPYMLSNIKETDCVLMISYGLNSQPYEQYFYEIKKHRGKVITISANASHIVSKNSECLVTIPNKEGTIKVSTFYSQFMFEVVLNLIYSRLYIRTKSSIK